MKTKWIGLLTIASALPLAIFFFKFILINKEIHATLASYAPIEWQFEQKITLIVNMTALISGYFLSVIMMVMGSRFLLAAVNPLAKNREEPAVIKFFNQVLHNSIEQAFVFIPILSAWTLNKCGNDDKVQVILFTLIWIFGRYLFILGYSMTMINDKLSTFRVFGFVLNFGSSLILALRLIGYPLV